MVWSRIDRWRERVPDKNMRAEYHLSRRVGKSARRKLNASLDKSSANRQRPGGPFQGIYYLISPCRAIFVMARGEKVVTVYPLPDIDG
jgi:hypothetical protein